VQNIARHLKLLQTVECILVLAVMKASLLIVKTDLHAHRVLIYKTSQGALTLRFSKDLSHVKEQLASLVVVFKCVYHSQTLSLSYREHSSS
jgi:hypothetical protein